MGAQPPRARDNREWSLRAPQHARVAPRDRCSVPDAFCPYVAVQQRRRRRRSGAARVRGDDIAEAKPWGGEARAGACRAAYGERPACGAACGVALTRACAAPPAQEAKAGVHEKPLRGLPAPHGASSTPQGVNFAVFSSAATAVSLVLYTPEDQVRIAQSCAQRWHASTHEPSRACSLR